jgi:hypothetical protein
VNVCLSLFIPANYLTILSAVAIAGGLCSGLFGLHLLGRKLLLGNMSTPKIDTAAPGLIEISGKAAGPHTLRAPITGKPCFLYRTTAWQQRDRGNREWRKVADETVHLPFFMEDSTGQLLVEPFGADLDLLTDFREEYTSELLVSDPPEVAPGIIDFLSRSEIDLLKPIRMEERLIRAADLLFIAGTLRENPGIQPRALSPGCGQDIDPLRDGCSDHSDSSPAPQVIRLTADTAASGSVQMGQQAKIAAALARAGIAKPEIWFTVAAPFETAVVEHCAASGTNSARSESRLDEGRVREEGLHQNPASSRFNLAPPVVLMKDASNPMFVISFRSQKECIPALLWKSSAFLCGGVALMLLGIYTILHA